MEFKKGQLNFTKDIKTGKEGEAFIRAFLENLGYVFLGECDNNAYDLKMAYSGQEYTYEVKTDTYSNTGNMAIEFESWGKVSGIDITQATYFTYFFPHLGEIWNIRCSKLKKLIAFLNPKVVIGGDEGSNTKMYLLRKKDVEQYFKVHRIQ